MADLEDDFLADGGEAGALMRSMDWTRSPLGPPSTWPRTLRTVVQIMLASRFAMRIVWGKEFIFLYNDGYRPILGEKKHRGAMGSRTSESFREVWGTVGPLFERVLRGEAFALDDTSLPLDRSGYLEECYFTLSYSPIRDDDGVCAGVLGVIHETTDRVLAARRLRSLRDLAAAAAHARTPELACVTAAEALAKNAADVPFALFYLTAVDGRSARLVATSVGASLDVPAPATIALDGSDPVAWPLYLAVSERRLHVVSDISERYGSLSAGPYPEAITSAVILPLARPGVAKPFGFLVAGVNPRHALDDAYRGFFDLAIEHVVTAITNAVAIEVERLQEERRRATAEDARAKLYSLFMQAPAAICVLRGPTHIYELANPPYRELVGGRDVLGKTLVDALPETAPSVLPLLDGVRRTGTPFFGNEVALPLLRDGRVQERFFNFIYQPVHDLPTDEVQSVFVIAFDVTDQIRGRIQAEELSRALETTNADLDQFAYVASHDLKAPLRGIANLSEWIEEGLRDKMDEESKNHMALLRGRVHRLEALIDGVLSYSRAGRARTRVETIDLAVLMNEVRDLLAPPVGVTLRIGAMPTVTGERVPLQQVFLNLIGNAMKHGKRDGGAGATIDVSATEDGAFVEVVVADDGPGIDPKYHERIWTIFQTLEARDKVEGTGIGLSVVKKIVEMRGGRTWVESAVGAGAAFHVRLPKNG